MPAQTAGFGVSTLPGIQYLPPQDFVPNYGAILPSIGQGLSLEQNLQAVADQAKQRPINQELANISLQNARSQALLTPIMTARKATELSQPIETPEGVGISTVPRYGDLQQMTDADGKPMFDKDGNPRMENIAGDDTFETQTIKKVDPITGATSVETRNAKPLSTVEQQQAAAALADYRDQLAQAKLQMAGTAAEAAVHKAENDRLRAEATTLRAQAALSDPHWKTVSAGEDESGNLIINQVNGSGEVRKIPTGEKKSHSFFNFGGLNVLPGAGASNGATGKPVASTAIDPDIQKLVSSLTQGAPAPDASVIPSFNSEAEAQAAAASGQIKSGQKIRVGGQVGTWQ